MMRKYGRRLVCEVPPLMPPSAAWSRINDQPRTTRTSYHALFDRQTAQWRHSSFRRANERKHEAIVCSRMELTAGEKLRRRRRDVSRRVRICRAVPPRPIADRAGMGLDAFGRSFLHRDVERSTMGVGPIGGV